MGAASPSVNAPISEMSDSEGDLLQYEPGDFVIIGILSKIYIFYTVMDFSEAPSSKLFDEILVMTPMYQQFLALQFALKEMNENPHILPNHTLGFHIYNGYFHPTWTYRASLELFSLKERFIPNYRCDIEKRPITVIGGPTSAVGDHLATILSLYKMPQWTWIGMLYSNSENGERFVEDLGALLSVSGICFAFTATLPAITYSNNILASVEAGIETFKVIMRSSANVVLIHGEAEDMIILRIIPTISQVEDVPLLAKVKVWVLTAQMQFTSLPFQRNDDIDFLHGALSFEIHSRVVLGFHEFLQMRKPNVNKKDAIIKLFWENAFECSFSNSTMEETDAVICTGEEKLGNLPSSVFEMDMTSHSYSVYNAAFAVAHALNHIQASVFRKRVGYHEAKLNLLKQQPWKLNQFVRRVSFNNSAGEKVSFNQKGELEVGFDIMNWIVFPNQSFLRVRIGGINGMDSQEITFSSPEDSIMWPRRFNQVQPLSLCNSKCHSGYRKKRIESEPFCCYDCLQCPNGKIANKEDVSLPSKLTSSMHGEVIKQIKQPANLILPWRDDITQLNNEMSAGMVASSENLKNQSTCIAEIGTGYMDDCFHCAEDQYPNNSQDLCLPKALTFLRYKEILGTILASSAVFCSFITAVVFWIFIEYQDTPLVKANNRNLTYVLLVALLLSFLCALLFIGQPAKMTCILRQTAVGVVFSVVISCVLAKTVIVVLAFMATKPGTKITKWAGKKLAMFVVFGCSFVQGIICTVWLIMSPPFPDANMSSMAVEIVLECNEGSNYMFYCVLGYMGFLAFISFIVAFLARKLPDAFNEAKFITFSMLVFCSVWLSFIPTYLSTKGKYMVAVEIFSIIASSIGIVICIFSPKCFIIVWRPDLNKKEKLSTKNHRRI
ncbi:vomeronasal type-2 receptor 26-like [Erythrolamprus reginae]|uniref:vomeronasal type-2 receptor 26-like n=1 Tax=Erythrolamprus reginae TaxID=121349 RepID=UPI00396C3930